MPKVPLAITQGNYVDVNDFGSRQFSLNMWPTFNQQEGSLTPTKVRRTPGLVAFTASLVPTVTSGYGGYATNGGGRGPLFINLGQDIFRIIGDGSSTIRASGLFGGGYTSMVFNSQNIMAVTKGDNAYFFDESLSTLTAITDATFLAIVGLEDIVSVVYIDGYFVFATETTLFTSSLETVNKGRNFDIDDTHEPNYKADKILDLKVVDGNLWVIGYLTIEVYDNTGAAGFPFDRIENIILDKGGCVHGRAIEIDDELYLIGRGPSEPYSVYRVSGNRFQKISTDVIDQALESTECDVSTFAPTTEQKLFTIGHDGHVFLGMTLTVIGINTTFMYDITESRRKGFPVWHRRGAPQRSSANYYFILDAVNIFNKNLGLGMYSAAPVFKGAVEIDSDISTEITEDVTRFVSTHYISNGMDRIKIKELTIRHKKVATGNIYLFFSNDRMTTMTSMGSRSLSDVPRWPRLGQGDDYAFIISNSPDLITADANSNDMTLYDAWVVAE